MNALNPEDIKTLEDRLAAEDRAHEALLFAVLNTEVGRALMGWIIHWDHGLAHVYQPGMSHDVAAWHAGRQYTARELARVASTSERCSRLFNQAYREEQQRQRTQPEDNQ